MAEPGVDPVGPTTTAGPEPLAVDVTDRVYLLDLLSGSWPPVLISQHDSTLLLGVTSVGPGTISALWATGDLDGNQDLCVPTSEVPPSTFADPHFDLPSVA